MDKLLSRRVHAVLFPAWTRGLSGSRRSRSGMTILEVMFAIMITTIGLLGAIAVFPVASEYARKGRLNDEVTICADAAVHRFDAQYMRRPDRWISYVYDATLMPPRYVPVITGAFPGESYCIDPRFYSQNANPNAQATVFPAYAQLGLFGVPANVGPPRMTRLTLPSAGPGSGPMGWFQANATFSFEDQLAYERPGVQKGSIARNDNALPAFQLYSPITRTPPLPPLPGKREDDGKLSWMATLVPKIDQHSGAMEDKYVLSTVIFYARNPNLVYPATGQLNEKSGIILGQSIADPTISDFHSNGYGGGEVTITAPTAGILDMRAGDWVMLAGYIRGPADVNSTDTDTLGNTPPYTVRRTFKWYRVTDADEDPYEFPVGSGNWKRDVTLVGADWDLTNVLPVQRDATTNNVDSHPDNFYDDVEVFIIPNVVAVFDRTIRLERDGTGF